MGNGIEKKVISTKKIGLILLIIIGVSVLLIYCGILTEISDIIKYFGYSLTVFTIYIAGTHVSIASDNFKQNVEQFKKNNEWQKREKALSVSWNLKKDLHDNINILEKEFNYIHRKDSDHALSVDEIHRKICKIDNQNNVITDANGKMEINGDEGIKIRNAITNCLDVYEYLAAGINEGVFEKNVILTLYKSAILRMYRIFQKYIEHYNDMYKKSNGRIWANMVRLAKEIEAEEIEKEKHKLDEK
jgi:hypothetical protein